MTPSDVVRKPWKQVIHEQLVAARQNPDDSTKSFVTDDQMYSIWDLVLTGHAYDWEKRDDPESLLPHDISTWGNKLLKVVSILVYIQWGKWSDFRSIFLDEVGCPRKDRADAALPFSLEAMEMSEFLGCYANLFNNNQYLFLPILIKEGRDQVFDHNYRLPIIWESKDCATGSYGEVSQVWVARGQFRFAKGKIVSGTVSLA